MTKQATKIEMESSKTAELRKNFPIDSTCERVKRGDGFSKSSYRTVGYKFTVKGYKYGDTLIDERGNMHRSLNIRCLDKKGKKAAAKCPVEIDGTILELENSQS